MLAVSLVAVWLAAAPPVARAEALAAKGDAEGLFVEFGAVKAEDFPEAERARLAKALGKGAEVARKDPMVALPLAEKAAQLDRSAAALTLVAAIEVDLGQRAAAAGHLDDALALKADHVPALIARAELAMKEEDFAVAAGMYEKAQAAGAKNVKAPLAKAREAAKAKDRAVEDLKKTESEIKVRVADAARNATRDWLKQILDDEQESDEKRRLAPDGKRRQEMAHFVFSYSTGTKRASELSAFESRVEKLLEKTYDFVSDKLGHQLEGKTQVILMPPDEYLAKYANSPMVRAAGFWDGREIVVNGGAQVDARFAEVMVHEFTHTMVSDLSNHLNVPRWMNEGLAENMRLCAIGLNGHLEPGARQKLGALKKDGKLPKLSELEGAFKGMVEGVEVAYALAAAAVNYLIENRGYSAYVEALRAMKTRRANQVIDSQLMPLEEIERAVVDQI